MSLINYQNSYAENHQNAKNHDKLRHRKKGACMSFCQMSMAKASQENRMQVMKCHVV
ncbi:hypothetical protein DsansV1_C29g0206631 [Dioscorea sansibarensis]